MAEVRLVLCEPLCFILSKFGKVGNKSIKSVVLDYYKPECISDAKMMLMDDINLIETNERIPYVSKRREGDNKTVRELDDIFTLINFLDEQKMIQYLPKYVTDNPDNIPTTRLFEGDLSFIVKKFEQFDNRFDAIGSALSAMMKDIQQVVRTQVSLPEWPALRSAQCVNNNGARPRISEPQHSMTSSVNNNNNKPGDDQLFHDGTDSASATSTPQTRRVGGSTSEASGRDDADETFTTVRSRGRKRHRQSTVDGQHLQTTSTAGSIPATTTNSTRRRGPLVVGKAASTSQHGIQAAKQYPSNRPDDRVIFYIDNVNVQHSDGDIRALAESMGVRVLSCFEVRPRRRSDTDATPPSWKAFRLCIRDRDRAALLDPGKWPAYVTVSEWYFKRNAEVTSDQRVDPAPAPARSGSTETGATSSIDIVSVDNAQALVACDLPTGDVPVVSATVSDQRSVSITVENCFGVLNEMDCSDDTIINDGSEC